MTSKMTCPRRAEMGQRKEDNADRWDRFGCNYCGSMNPESVMPMIEAGDVELGPTDKSYKAYVLGAEGKHLGKLYFQHLSTEQQELFIQLVNEKRMRIGYPGHFYVTPFFATTQPPAAQE